MRDHAIFFFTIYRETAESGNLKLLTVRGLGIN